MSAPTPASWTLRFAAPADWLSANKQHKRRPNEQIRAWREATAVHAAAQGIPRGLSRVSVFATLHFTDRRRRDAHNFMLSVKSCIDGLVDHGLIPDDNRRHLLWTAVSEGDPVPKRTFGPAGLIDLLIVAAPLGSDEIAAFSAPTSTESAESRQSVRGSGSDAPNGHRASQAPPSSTAYATTGGI